MQNNICWLQTIGTKKKKKILKKKSIDNNPGEKFMVKISFLIKVQAE